jgi:hypothetical protein
MPETAKPMGMFLQDPSLPTLHEDFDFAATGDFLDGTGSSRFCIRDADLDTNLPLYSSLDWSRSDLSFARFERAGLVDNPQFHQVNAFAVVTRTLALVESELGGPIRWKEGGPLIVRPHAFEGFNAYYDPSAPSLNFGYAPSLFRRGPVWTCLSHDIVSHELGHAILDNFRPLFLTGFDPDVGALHESIGDLLALFSALQHASLVRLLFEESGGNMRRPSVITRLAEEFGIGIHGGGLAFLRSSLDQLVYDDDAPLEPHSRSVIWTGAIYELMTRLVENAVGHTPTFDAFVAAVINASRWTRGMLIRALHYMPPTGVGLPQLARLVWEADARVFPADPAFREIARDVFTQRGLWDESIDLTAPDIGKTFESLASADSATLARAVMDHAVELNIPLGIGARMLTPRLVKSVRQVDNVKDADGVEHLTTIVEHYLNFAFEILLPLEFDLPTGETLSFAVPLTFGGTLVMDEEWTAMLLAGNPVIKDEDVKTGDPVLAALRRAMTSIRHTLTGHLAAGGGPFEIAKADDGSARITRRTCDLQEHLRGVSGSQPLFPFAPDR